MSRRTVTKQLHNVSDTRTLAALLLALPYTAATAVGLAAMRRAASIAKGAGEYAWTSLAHW
jgi:phytoene/squalene synthetase